MITEDYVSLEVAKLLKEKRFDECCHNQYYVPEKDLVHLDYESSNSENDVDWITAPTLQMAMKWLREVYNIHITVHYSSFLYGTHPYYWSIDKMDSIPRANTQIEISTNTHDYSFVHYEKCCESAIKYCLENLI